MDSGYPINPENLEELIEAIFQDAPNVYEAYSIPDNDLRSFSSKSEVMEYIDEVSISREKLVYLSIHYPRANGFFLKERIDLVPEKCNGATFRFSAGGWGLIHFQLRLKENGMTCDIKANSEKRALAWEHTHPEFKSPELWNWKEVQSQCRRLKRILKKCA